MLKRKPASAQLSADEMQQVKWLLGGVLTLISIATVVYLDIDAWILMGLTTVAAIAVVMWPSLPGRIPRWAHRLAFPIVAAVFSADLWLTGELLPSMVRLDILLLLYRVISYRQKRDDLQLVVLGLFLLVVAGVLTVSLTFAAHIIVFTACALALLLVITLAEASSGQRPVMPAPEQTPEWARTVEWRKVLRRMRQATDWRVVALGGGLFGGLMILSALLFVAIPRFQLENGLFLDRFITKKARSGFSDHIKFGEVSEIQQDNGVAVSVDVSDRTQIPPSPYWRMLVLDEYRDGAFRLSAMLRAKEFPVEETGTSDAGRIRRRRGGGGVWTFYLEAGISRYLPLLGPYDWLNFGESHSFRSSGTLGLVALRDDPVTMVAYRVGGMSSGDRLPDAAFGSRLASRDVDAAGDALMMLGLSLDAKDRLEIDRVVAEIMGKTALPASAFATAAVNWLASHHAYSLHPVIPAGGGDPLVRWLVSRESGHCELFAGSLVVLARSAGFPARVVTGFRGGSWNGYSNNFTLRNSDAHAWCEVFDAATQSWWRVDPTPGGAGAETNAARGELALARRNDRSWKARLESLRVFWYRQIVSFDQRSQIETFNAVRQATDFSSRRICAAFEHLRESMRGWIAQPWDGQRVWLVARFLLLSAGAVWLSVRGVRAWKSRRWQGRGGRSLDLVRMEAGKWLARLAEGHASTASEGKRETDVIERLQQIRYGRSETWRDVATVFGSARKLWRAKRKWKRGRLV
jgi:hypothetical protein